MASKYSSYSEARSIARKRLERLNEAGYQVDNISFPTVKQLKERGISPGAALRTVEEFLKAPTKLIEFRKESKSKDLVFRQTASGVQIGERERQMKRARDERYRERVRNLTKDEKRYMKAAKRLGLNITPSTAKAFAEYVDYRYSQGVGSVKYWMANIVEDYMDIVKNKPKASDTVLKDFHRFLADRQSLLDEMELMVRSGSALAADVMSAAWMGYADYMKKQREA